MIKVTDSIKNKYEDLIYFDLRYRDDDASSPVIIYSHGFKSSRTWGFIPLLCDELCEKGFMVLNFDFSLNGIQDHNKPLFDSEKFRKNTVSREIEDLDFIISSFINSSLFEKQRGRWNGEIYLAGHSLGGAVSLMTAGKFPEVKKIALLASIAELDRNTEHQKKIWKEKGYTKVKIAGTGQELFLDYNYLKDKENNFPDNAILKHASELKIPVLIIHASEDMVVKEQEALKLRENIKNAEFHVIKHTGHTFSAQHPLKRRPETLNKLVKLMTIFFRNA